MSEEISSQLNSAEIFDHECDESGINLVNTEEELDFTCIHSTNETNNISKNDVGNFYINIMHNFYQQILRKMYP